MGNMAIRCPSQSGFRYYKYNGFYLVVKLALVDTDCRCLWADVGSNASCSDTQTFNESQLNQSFLEETMGFPHADPLPGDDRDMPYFTVAADEFPLSAWLVKPLFGRKFGPDRWWRMILGY